MKKLLLTIPLIFITSCTGGEPKQLPLELESRKSAIRQVAENAKNSGNQQVAIDLQTQTMALDANNPESFINLAKTLKKAGQSQDAVDFLSAAVNLHPTNDELKISLAKALVENNQPSEAITALQEVRGKDRDYYNSLGVAYDMLNRHDEAQDTFSTGLENYEDDELLLNNLALSYIMSGEYQNGIDILEDLVKLPNAKPKYRQNLALAYGLSAKPDQAKKLLVKDLSKKEAEENLKFYKELRSKK